MTTLNPFVKILVILVLLFTFSCTMSCNAGKKDKAAAATGCCQVTATSCASPVTQVQCDSLNGISFHEGGDCRTESGTCGVLQEEE